MPDTEAHSNWEVAKLTDDLRREAAPGSIREVEAYGVDGTYKSVVRAETPEGLHIELDDSTGRVVIRDGVTMLAMYGQFFSIKISQRTPG